MQPLIARVAMPPPANLLARRLAARRRVDFGQNLVDRRQGEGSQSPPGLTPPISCDLLNSVFIKPSPDSKKP